MCFSQYVWSLGVCVHVGGATVPWMEWIGQQNIII